MVYVVKLSYYLVEQDVGQDVSVSWCHNSSAEAAVGPTIALMTSAVCLCWELQAGMDLKN